MSSLSLWVFFYFNFYNVCLINFLKIDLIQRNYLKVKRKEQKFMDQSCWNFVNNFPKLLCNV